MTTRRFIALVLALSGLAIGSPALAVVSDATNLFVITKTGFVLNRTTNTYDTTVTLKNTSPFTVNAPVQLAVSGLPAGVTLANAAGTNQGKPYVNVTVPGSAIIAGQIVTPIVLKFSNPSRVTITAKLAVIGDIPDAAVGFPPDPGEAGKATVAGIDSNGNGVRDDVERWIAISYSTSTKTRLVLTQYAKANQQMLLASDIDSEVAIRTSMEGIQKAQQCLRYIMPGTKAEGPRRTLKAVALNTAARTNAYINFNAYWERHPIIGKDDFGKAACEFDPDTIGD